MYNEDMKEPREFLTKIARHVIDEHPDLDISQEMFFVSIDHLSLEYVISCPGCGQKWNIPHIVGVEFDYNFSGLGSFLSSHEFKNILEDMKKKREEKELIQKKVYEVADRNPIEYLEIDNA